MASISIIMPLYNKASFVSRAIDSILAQTWQDFEIVVVDDGSTDNSSEIVKSYEDNRIRIIRQANAGPGAARNRGVKEATSEYITFLDADDEYLSGFLQTSITNLKNNPDCVLSVVNHYRGIDKTIATTVFPFNIGIVTGSWRLPHDCDVNEMWGSLIFLQSWVIVCRREVILEFGGSYENRCTYGEDQYLWLQILLNYRIYRDTTPLFWYHTEDSELEMWARKTATPILPFLSDPNPIRKNCPPEYRPILEKLFSYAASLNFSYMVPDESVVEFWRIYLRGIPEMHELPLDHPRPKEPSMMSKMIFFDIDSPISERVRTLCEEHFITPDIFFLACLAFLVWKHSSQDMVIIGTPYANREQEEIQGLFGCFTRTIPVRFDVNSSLDNILWLEYVKDQFMKAWSHTSIGFDDLVDLSAVQRKININPIYQIIFAFQDSNDLFGSEKIESEASDLLGCDLALRVSDSDHFKGVLNYSADIFDADSMEMFASNFVRAVNVMSGFECRLDNMELMDSQAWKLIKRTNMTEVPENFGKTFLDLFRDSLCTFRSAVAIKFDDGTELTYDELDRLSDGIARKLVDAGVKTGGFVGVYLNRDRWLLPSLLGVFKACGAYIPLDPHIPRDRIAAIIADAGIRCILTTSQLKIEVTTLESDIYILCADDGAPSTGITLPTVLSGHPAYVLFTSGSTGKPKGVPICHGSLANLLLSMKFKPGLTHNDTVLAITTFTFDISTLEFFLPLISGAKLVLVDHDTSLDSVKLVSLVEREHVTFMQATPSHWTLIFETGWKARPDMTLLTGGEALPQTLAKTLLATGASIWNMYGPTETTVWSSVYQLQQADPEPYIGKPIANTGFYILDRTDRVLPAGIPGELAISGVGLSEGYLNRPDLTSGRFIYINDDGIRQRVYKTGDLGLQKASGIFRCFGRTDFQVKIRGFRIELGEIETIILGYTGIKESVCTVWTRSEQDKRIIAYYRADSHIDESLLKAHIKKSLPDYMVPSHFMTMADFPLTSSGKIDRKALPLPEFTSKGNVGKSPATELQEQILSVWREILGLDAIGIEENFFDLGGHSILAVELIRKLNSRIGGKWKLRDLFETPTIEGLANMVGSSGSSRMPLLFPASTRGKGSPLFLVAGVYSSHYFEDEGQSSYEQDFLRYFNNILIILGNERPVYGLRPRGIYIGERFHPSVEEMAREYITEIKAIQPNGPYLIGGECLGGAVAHAIACQLREQGDTVSKLVLLDTYRIWLGKEIVMRLYDYLRDIKRIIIATYKTLRHPVFSRKALTGWIEKGLILFFPITKSLRERRYLELGSRKYANLLMHYRPKRFDGETLLIINENWNARYPSLGWDSKLCSHLDIQIVPGDHTTRLNIEKDALERCFRDNLE